MEGGGLGPRRSSRSQTDPHIRISGTTQSSTRVFEVVEVNSLTSHDKNEAGRPGASMSWGTWQVTAALDSFE